MTNSVVTPLPELVEIINKFDGKPGFLLNIDLTNPFFLEVENKIKEEFIKNGGDKNIKSILDKLLEDGILLDKHEVEDVFEKAKNDYIKGMLFGIIQKAYKLNNEGESNIGFFMKYTPYDFAILEKGCIDLNIKQINPNENISVDGCAIITAVVYCSVCASGQPGYNASDCTSCPSLQ